MIQVRFGSTLSALDPTLGLAITPRCFGEAQLRVVDAAAYQAAVAQMGGEEALAPAVQQSITKNLGRVFGQVVEAKGILQAIRATPTIIQETSAGVDRELASMGAAVQIGDLTISLSKEDLEHVQRLTAELAAKKREQAQQLTPGTHVIARWTDGREFGATIRSWTGTHYEIVWDGGSASAFVAKELVRPA